MKRPFFVDLVRNVVSGFTDRSSHAITTEELRALLEWVEGRLLVGVLTRTTY